MHLQSAQDGARVKAGPTARRGDRIKRQQNEAAGMAETRAQTGERIGDGRRDLPTACGAIFLL